MNFEGYDLEAYCRFLGDKFLEHVSRRSKDCRFRRRRFRMPPIGGGVAFAPAGPSGRNARIEIDRSGIRRDRVRPLRLQAAAARRQRVSGFRPGRVHDAAGSQESPAPHVARSRMALRRRQMRRSPEARSPQGASGIVQEVFASTESGSIQQLIHRIGTKLLADSRDFGGGPRSQQSHLGYDCRARGCARRLHRRAAALWMSGTDVDRR